MVLGDTWAGIECNIEPALLAAAPSGSNQHPISLRSLVPPRTPGSFCPQSSPAPHDLVLLLLPLCPTFYHQLTRHSRRRCVDKPCTHTSRNLDHTTHVFYFRQTMQETTLVCVKILIKYAKREGGFH
jgi:hypothetical protein